jgi:hypothetical protein
MPGRHGRQDDQPEPRAAVDLQRQHQHGLGLSDVGNPLGDQIVSERAGHLPRRQRRIAPRRRAAPDLQLLRRPGQHRAALHHALTSQHRPGRADDPGSVSGRSRHGQVPRGGVNHKTGPERSLVSRASTPSASARRPTSTQSVPVSVPGYRRGCLVLAVPGKRVDWLTAAAGGSLEA